MQAVTGKHLPSIDATLRDYCRYSIKNEVYPAIIAQQGKIVRGKLFSGLSQSFIRCIDLFEDVIYIRRNCEVMTAEKKPVNAFVYVISDTKRYMLSDKPWCVEEFRHRYLGEYLDSCKNYSPNVAKCNM